MTDANKPPVWYWIVTGFYLLWNGMGVKEYFIQVNNADAIQAKLQGAELEAYLATPTWVMRAFAVAVLLGFLASIFLMVRKRFAYPMALTSLVAVIAQMSYGFFVTKPDTLIMPILVILFSLGLLFFSKYSKSKGWLV